MALAVALDAGIVAPLIERSYEMFGSLAGTWLPFALIALGGWAGASLSRRTHPEAKRTS